MAMKRKNLPAVVPELFEHEEFGQFRFIKRGEEILFVGKDVAIALGYKEPEKAVREHVPDKFKGVSVLDTPGGKQKVVIISEAGLYRLAFSSKLPSAVKFTDWVCEEVLPSIRKYGYYIAPQKIEENLPELPAPNTVVKGFEEITTLMKKNGDEWYYDWLESTDRNGEKKYTLGLKPFPRYFAKIIFDD